jgi:hypothetical protein
MAGFAAGLHERLKEQQEWLESQQNSGSAIVLLTDEVALVVEDFWKDNRRGTGYIPRVNRDGFAAGKQAGRNTNLAERMNG